MRGYRSRARAPQGAYRRYGPEVVAALATIGYSAVLNRLLPDGVHIPANVTAAAVSTMVARTAGVSLADLGLAPAGVPSGIRLGASIAAPAVAAVAVAAIAPATRRHFVDARVVDADHPFYEVALRIPVGTALCEEVIFRGALFGLFARHRSVPVAIAMSSAVFGAWHVLPTLASRPSDAPRSVLTAVAVTTLAGCGLAVLRVRSRSIVAPVLVHAAVNVSVFAAVRLIGRGNSDEGATLSAFRAQEALLAAEVTPTLKGWS